MKVYGVYAWFSAYVTLVTRVASVAIIRLVYTAVLAPFVGGGIVTIASAADTHI
jgi:hypothetical protein